MLYGTWPLHMPRDPCPLPCRLAHAHCMCVLCTQKYQRANHLKLFRMLFIVYDPWLELHFVLDILTQNQVFTYPGQFTIISLHRHFFAHTFLPPTDDDRPAKRSIGRSKKTICGVSMYTGTMHMYTVHCYCQNEFHHHNRRRPNGKWRTTCRSVKSHIKTRTAIIQMQSYTNRNQSVTSRIIFSGRGCRTQLFSTCTL